MNPLYEMQILNNVDSSTTTISHPLAYIHATFNSVDNAPSTSKELQGSQKASPSLLDVTSARVQNRTAQSSSNEVSDATGDCSAPVEWPVHCLELKCLVQLHPGLNDINITFCGVDHKLIINHEQEEISEKRFVRLVYIVCAGSDGAFLSPNPQNNTIEDAKHRISLNALMLQAFVAENMHAHECGRTTFELEGLPSSPVVHVFHSKLEQSKAITLTGNELYDIFHKELYESDIYDPLCKFLTFMSCTDYQPPDDPKEFDPKKAYTYVRAHTALGGGRLALFGTGGLHTWAATIDEVPKKFTDQSIIDPMKLFDDSCGRKTYWANYSTTLGAAMHELGHCFDLAHTSDGIMGRGFDDMNRFFVAGGHKKGDGSNKAVSLAYRSGGCHWFRSSAIILSNHRWLNQNRKSAFDAKSCRADISPIVYTNPAIRGPFGNNGPYQLKGQESFDSREWCKVNKASLIGFIFHGRRYIDALQFVAVRKPGHHHSGKVVVGNTDPTDGGHKSSQGGRNALDKDDSDHPGKDKKMMSGICGDDDDGKPNKGKKTLLNVRGDADKDASNPSAKRRKGKKKISDVRESRDSGKDKETSDTVTTDPVPIVKDDTIQGTSAKSCEDDDLLYSPIYGNSVEDTCTTYSFYVDPMQGERIVAVDVRAGAWVDAIRIHTNLKSSVWFGGKGGDHYRVVVPSEYSLCGIFGSSAAKIGSIGIAMEHNNCEQKTDLSTAHTHDDFHIESTGNIQVIEIQNATGDVVHFFDYSKEIANPSIVISRAKLQPYLPCRLYIADDEGVITGMNVK